MWLRGVNRGSGDVHQRKQEDRARARAAFKEKIDARKAAWLCEAERMFNENQSDPLFMLGVGLYWGEGSKSGVYRTLSLSNADPKLLRVWVEWCRKFIPACQLVVQVQIHADVEKEFAKSFWADALGLADVMVYRVEERFAERKHHKKLPAGTARVRLRKGASEWSCKMLLFMNQASITQR